ncbi:MAG: hypothetical protein ACFB15_08365 [Cyclobacteriaceae bacterium]
MKKVIASLTLALAVGILSPSFAATEPTAVSDDSFQIKFFVRSQNTSLDVFVERTDGTLLLVKFRDASGRVLAKGKIADDQGGVRFDMSNLKDGIYQVEVTDGDTKQIESFELKSTTRRSLTLQ